VSLLSQSNFIMITVIQSFDVISTAACESTTRRTMISVNLVSELIYFDLVVNELSTSMNDNKMIFLMKDTLIFYPRLIVLTV